MGERDFSDVSRFKREECDRTKHDYQFSDWKVLIGFSDWKDHSLGKEGAVRYRIHNLPKSSVPGLYELGVAVSHSGLGREVGRLDLDRIVVVYLGQAENVRTRLQSYGRSGAHLGTSYSTDGSYGCETELSSDIKVPGLFDEIFSRGYSIVYRWASMTNKRDAEKTEADLLGSFDYAWNKGSNGVRRPKDVFEKIKRVASRKTKILNLSWDLLSFPQKQVGIKIEARKPVATKKESDIYVDEGNTNFLSSVFKFSRSQPRLVLDKCVNEEFIIVCGFILNDGTPCRKPPVLMRKRCEEHKGRKIHGFNLSAKGNSQPADGAHLESVYHNDSNTCGVYLGGEICRRRPVVGRKRCEEHKGMKVNAFSSELSVQDKFMPAISSGFATSNYTNYREDFSTQCGATLVSGSFCTRRPTEGNKRCWQHKSKKVESAFSSFDTQTSFSICGVTLRNGSVCTRAPVHGRKRCEQHKGMRLTS